MRLKKIYSQGVVKNEELYNQLQDLDKNYIPAFHGCANEFKPNRDWWVMVDHNGCIVAYCGSVYAQGICIMNRAWVHKRYRGNGYQKKMIFRRIQTAKSTCHTIITYTTVDNVVSANNLIKCGFKLYTPEYAYGRSEMLYWIRKLN